MEIALGFLAVIIYSFIIGGVGFGLVMLFRFVKAFEKIAAIYEMKNKPE